MFETTTHHYYELWKPCSFSCNVCFVLCCSSPANSVEAPETLGFQIYQETGLTPVPGTRTAAVEAPETMGFQIYQETGLTPVPGTRTAAAAVPKTLPFQIYQETVLTPAPCTRTGAVTDQGLSVHSVKNKVDDKENQFLAVAAAVNVLAEEEPMAVDWVNVVHVFLLFWC